MDGIMSKTLNPIKNGPTFTLNYKITWPWEMLLPLHPKLTNFPHNSSILKLPKSSRTSITIKKKNMLSQVAKTPTVSIHK